MQAITTKVISATNTKPTRIKAFCARGSLYFSTTHLTVEIGSESAHRDAALALVAKFCKEDAEKYGSTNNPWARPFLSGQIKSGEFVHVFGSGFGNSLLVEFANSDDRENFVHYRERAQKQDGTVSGCYAGIMCSAIKRSKI